MTTQCFHRIKYKNSKVIAEVRKKTKFSCHMDSFTELLMHGTHNFYRKTNTTTLHNEFS